MSAEREEVANEVFHGISSDEKLKSMSFSDLSIELAGCQKDSPKISVIQREMKKILARDQAKINLPNMLFAACIGGVFALSGVVLGAYLKNSPTFEQVAPRGTVQQMKDSDLAIKPRNINVAPSIPPVTDQAIKPAPVQNNGQPR